MRDSRAARWFIPAGLLLGVLASPASAQTTGDTPPPMISDVGPSSLTEMTAIIDGRTNEAADGQLEFDTTTTYGSASALQTSLKPAAVSWGANRLDLFARLDDGAMWHKWFNGSTWSAWENQGGTLTSDPTAVSWGANRLDVFARGVDNAVWWKAWNGSGWTGWQSLGGQLQGTPAAVSWGANRLDLFARGADGAMLHKWFNGSTWSAWENQGGTLTSDPTVVSWGANRLDLFARGIDNAVWWKAWNGVAWSAWQSLGGQIQGTPAAVSWGANRTDLFARGADGAMLHKWFNGSAWSAWENQGGALTSDPTVASWAANRLDVFARGAEGAMWHKWWNGSAWSAWESQGGTLTADPTVVSWGVNRFDLFARGVDNAMWWKVWDGVAWGGWQSLGAPGYAVSGSAGVAGARVVAGGVTATSDATGQYTILGLANGTHTVTPFREGENFVPASRSVTVGPSATGINFVATGPRFSISGNAGGVAGATVQAGGVQVVTNAAGGYTFGNLPSGTYIVVPSKACKVFSPRSLTVSIGPSSSGNDFVVGAIGHTVSGSVGRAGVTVTVSGSAVTSMVSDAAGHFSVSQLACGSYTLTPSKPGYVFSPASASITVDADKTVDFASFTAPWIYGLISGLGAEGTEVTVSSATFTKSMVVNSSKNYKIDDVPSGTYTVTPRRANTVFTPPYSTATVWTNASETHIASCDFSTESNVISGTIAGLGAGYPVYFYRNYYSFRPEYTPSWSKVDEDQTDAAGKYESKKLPPGEYKVKPWYYQTPKSYTPAELIVTLGPSRSNVNFTVNSAFSISGSVGQGGVTIETGGRSVTSTSSGSYTIPQLAPGTYLVKPSKPGVAFSPATRSVVITTANKTGVNFSPVAGYTVAGRITTSAGVGVSGVNLVAWYYDRASSSSPWEKIEWGVVVSDSAGNYLIGGLQTHTNYAGVTSGGYTISPWKNGQPFYPGERGVTIGPSVTGVDFSTTAPTYSISGHVGGAAARIIASCGAFCTIGTAETDSAGNYTITGLLGRTYTVTPKLNVGWPGLAGSFAPLSRSVTVGPNATGVDFSFGATYSVSGNAGVGGATVSAGGVTTTAGATGSFTLAGLAQGSYVVTPSKAGWVFEPPSRSVSVVSFNVTGVGFTATAVATTHRISGSVGKAGATVTAGSKTATSDANGAYSLAGLTPGTYTVTPSSSGCTFTPATRSVTVGSLDVGQVDFTYSCGAGGGTTYTISGNTATAGVTVKAGTASVVSDAQGNYTLTVPPGTYGVKASKTGCLFYPATHNVTVGPNADKVSFTSPCVLANDYPANDDYAMNYVHNFSFGPWAEALHYTEWSWVRFNAALSQCYNSNNAGMWFGHIAQPAGPVPSCMPGVPFWKHDSRDVGSPGLCAPGTTRTHVRPHLTTADGSQWWSGYLATWNGLSMVASYYKTSGTPIMGTCGNVSDQGGPGGYLCAVLNCMSRIEVMDPIGWAGDAPIMCNSPWGYSGVYTNGPESRTVVAGELTPDGWGFIPSTAEVVNQQIQKWIFVAPSGKNLYEQDSFGRIPYTQVGTWAVPGVNPKGHGQIRTQPDSQLGYDIQEHATWVTHGGGDGPNCPAAAQGRCRTVSPRSKLADMDGDGKWDRLFITGYATSEPGVQRDTEDLLADFELARTGGELRAMHQNMADMIGEVLYWLGRNGLNTDFEVYGHSLGGVDAVLIYRFLGPVFTRYGYQMHTTVYEPGYGLNGQYYSTVPGQGPIWVYQDPMDPLTNGPNAWLCGSGAVLPFLDYCRYDRDSWEYTDQYAERTAAGAIVNEIHNVPAPGGLHHDRFGAQACAGRPADERF